MNNDIHMGIKNQFNEISKMFGLTECRNVNSVPLAFNPLRTKVFRGNKVLYFHFMSFLHIDMRQVVEIISQVRHELTHPIQ